jgi:hypothetical protein
MDFIQIDDAVKSLDIEEFIDKCIDIRVNGWVYKAEECGDKFKSVHKFFNSDFTMPLNNLDNNFALLDNNKMRSFEGDIVEARFLSTPFDDLV